MYEKLGMFKLLMCSVPVHLKPTDNLTWFPAESRAVLRPGCLLCLFCGFGYFFFFPADCQQSVHPGMLWRSKGSSRSVICQHQLLPRLFLGGKQQAQLSQPSVLLLCLLWLQREGSSPTKGKREWRSRRDWRGRGSVVYLEALWGRNQFSLKKRGFGDCGFEGTGLSKRNERIWRVSSGAVRG